MQDGTRADASAAGKGAIFTAELSAEQCAAFNTATPNRIAIKHVHSQQNPERDWCKFTLQSIEFAYYVLNEKYADLASDGKTRLKRLTPANTIVIASSVSNGAGAALAAAELDTQGLISGVAVAEPQIQLQPDARLSVKRGRTTLAGTGRSLYDYTKLANLLQPCAALVSTSTNVFNTINPTIAANRCNALKERGLISDSTSAELAQSSMDALSLLAGSLRAMTCKPRITRLPRWQLP